MLFVFCQFLEIEHVKFLENRNMIFENTSLEIVLEAKYQGFRVFAFPGILDIWSLLLLTHLSENNKITHRNEHKITNDDWTWQSEINEETYKTNVTDRDEPK